MNKFVPNTAGVNQDREYFIKENTFVKIDTVVDRGKNEALILSSISHPNIQKYVNSYLEEGKHFLETEYFDGETLENLNLNGEQVNKVESQLMEVLSYLIKKQVTHGDINVSNILFNGESILIIDWETSSKGDALSDLFGPEYPTKHCGIINVIRIIREGVLG